MAADQEHLITLLPFLLARDQPGKQERERPRGACLP